MDKQYVAKLTTEHPVQHTLTNDDFWVVVAEGREIHFKWAFFKCPCSCGKVVMLNLQNITTRHWSLTLDEDNHPTINPSINRTGGCKSHFWIKDGKIEGL